jgi:hypothetical protein
VLGMPDLQKSKATTVVTGGTRAALAIVASIRSGGRQLTGPPLRPASVEEKVRGRSEDPASGRSVLVSKCRYAISTKELIL